MVVSCRTENGKWRIDEVIASHIPGLRHLFQEKAAKFGVEYAAYVCLFADKLSIYATFKDDKDRSEMAAHAVWGNEVPVKLLKDKAITSAIEEYERISDTQEARTYRAIERVIHQVTEKLNSVEVDDKNMDDVMATSAKLPALIEKLTQLLEKAKTAEGNVITKVRGNATLGWAESQAINGG